MTLSTTKSGKKERKTFIRISTLFASLVKRLSASRTRLDPWAIEKTIEDYEGVIREWGLSPFDDTLLAKIKDPLPMMRRHVLFAHRDFELILDRIERGEPFVMMTGLMPSGKMHFGHKLVVDQMRWYQDHGADLVVAISDIEAWMVRGIPPSEATKVAIEEYIANYLALGIDYKTKRFEIYSQWKRPDLLNLAAAFSGRRTFAEMNDIYGFIKLKEDSKALTQRPSHLDKIFNQVIEIAKSDKDGALNLLSSLFDMSLPSGKTFFPFIQVADILHPQMERYGGPRPVVVPVGIDQDPHIRLTRDVAQDWGILNVQLQGEICIYLSGKGNPNKLLDLAKTEMLHLGFHEFDPEGQPDLLKDPAQRVLFVKQAGTVDIPAMRESLKEIEAQMGEKMFHVGERVGVFVSASESTEKVDKILELTKRALRRAGYSIVQVMPSYNALYVIKAGPEDLQKINEIAIKIEHQLGRHVFYPPASTYHKLATGLTGGKMSSSKPESAVFLTDTVEEISVKLRNAVTGGKPTKEEQRKLGGKPSECNIYEMVLFHHPSDQFVTTIREECISGQTLCGECKSRVIEYFSKFIKNLHEKRNKLVTSGELERFLEKQDIPTPRDPLWW